MSSEFLIILFLTLIASSGIIFSKKLMYKAIFLLMIFMIVGVVFILAKAEFLAVAQIVIYVGGILILLLFGILITDEKSSTGHSLSSMLGYGLISFILFIVLLNSIFQNDHYALEKDIHFSEDLSNSHQIGILMMSKYLVSLEMVAILLLLALIGSVILSGRKKL